MARKPARKKLEPARTNDSRREANKRDKLDRIKNAARDLFLENGYEGATLRQIASRAEVAFGTLFLYAIDKADLLLLLFDDDLQRLGNAAFKHVDRSDTFVDQLIVIFREYYVYFLKMPDLSRYMMRDATFSRHAPPADRMLADMRRTEGRLAQVVAEAQDDEKIDPNLPADMLAQFIFMIYRAEIRAFLDQQKPTLDEGLRTLRRDLEMLVNGLRVR